MALRNLRVAPIQVGLFCVEIMVSNTDSLRDQESMRNGPNHESQFVWWMATVFPIAPEYTSSPASDLFGKERDSFEPGMLIGRVVGNVIHDDANVSLSWLH